MKGNRGSDGATIESTPFEWTPSILPAPVPQPEPARPVPPRRPAWRRPSLLLAIILVAVVGLVMGLVIAFNSGGDTAASANGGSAPEEPVALALAGTPTHTPGPTSTPEPIASATPGETPAVELAGTVAADSATPATISPATPESTIAVPVRVRYEVVAGDTCDRLRQEFGFPATSTDDFATALIRISGRPPATGCSLRESEIVCIPTPADLEQLDSLARDAACLLGATPAAGS